MRRRVFNAVDYKLCIVLKPKGLTVHCTAGFAILTLYLHQIKFDAALWWYTKGRLVPCDLFPFSCLFVVPQFLVIGCLVMLKLFFLAQNGPLGQWLHMTVGVILICTHLGLGDHHRHQPNVWHPLVSLPYQCSCFIQEKHSGFLAK